MRDGDEKEKVIEPLFTLVALDQTGRLRPVPIAIAR